MLSAPMALGLALVTVPILHSVAMFVFFDDSPPKFFIWIYLGMGAAGVLLVLYSILKGKTTD